MSLIGRNCARGKTRVLLAQSDPNKAHVRPEASPRGYPAFAERFLMHPTSEGRSTTRGGCDCRRQLRRASEQSVAERRLTAPVVDPFDNPGPAGRLKARTPGELRCPGLQLLQRNGWDSRRGAADCSCEVCGQEGEQARKDTADGRARDCRVKGDTLSKKTTAVYQCGVGSRRSEDAIQRNVEGSGEEKSFEVHRDRQGQRRLAIEEAVRDNGWSVQDCGGGRRHVSSLHGVGKRCRAGT